MKSIYLLIFPLLLVSNAYADSAQAEPSLNWHIKTTFEKINESFTGFIFGSEAKAKILLDNAKERQKEINEYAKNNLQIPKIFEALRIEKLNEAKDVIENIRLKMPEDAQEKSNVLAKLENAFDNVKSFGELNDIRIAVSDFYQLRKMTDEGEKQKLAQKIDSNVNALKSARENCSVINSLALANSDDPYTSLQELCPKLKSINAGSATSMLYG